MADDPWHQQAFVGSLQAASPNTVAAYGRDLAAFVDWAERLGAAGPAEIDRKVLRRYVSYLSTRGYARRTIARKASAIRKYFGWLLARGLVPSDPSASLSVRRDASRRSASPSPESRTSRYARTGRATS